MHVRIDPAPTPEEERALRLALARAFGDGPRESAWWRQGIAEAVLTEATDEPPGATL